MTTYSTISNASLAVGAIPSSTVVTALRDNPIAMAEAASGAPINVAGWHPVDKVTVGDGKDGLIYDSATAGAVASIVTADFEDGYEYMLYAIDLSHNDAGNQSLSIEIYLATDAAYSTIYTSGTVTNSMICSFQFETVFPRISKKVHMMNLQWIVGNAGTDSAYKLLVPEYVATAQKILRVRIKFSAGSIDAGKVWMFRRREFASSP